MEIPGRPRWSGPIATRGAIASPAPPSSAHGLPPARHPHFSEAARGYDSREGGLFVAPSDPRHGPRGRLPRATLPMSRPIIVPHHRARPDAAQLDRVEPRPAARRRAARATPTARTSAPWSPGTPKSADAPPRRPRAQSRSSNPAWTHASTRSGPASGPATAIWSPSPARRSPATRRIVASGSASAPPRGSTSPRRAEATRRGSRWPAGRTGTRGVTSSTRCAAAECGPSTRTWDRPRSGCSQRCFTGRPAGNCRSSRHRRG